MKSKLTKIYKWFLKPLFVVFLILSVTLISVTVALQIPYFQLLAVKGVVKLVENKTQHRISLRAVDVNWFDTGTFHDVVLYDFKDQEMIRASSVRFDFDLADFYQDRKITFDRVLLDTASLTLVKYSDTVSLNLSEFLQRLGGNAGEDPVFILADHLEVDLLTFSYDHNQRLPRPATLFDHNHFQFEARDVGTGNVDIRKGEIRLDMEKFSGKEVFSGVEIMSFVSKVIFTQKSLALNETRIETRHSSIGNTLVFNYSHPSRLGLFMDSVQLDMELKDIRIGHRDLKHFAHLKNWEEDIYLTSEVSGTIRRLMLRNTTARLTGGSYFNGRVSFSGLPVWEETFIDLNVNSASLSPYRTRKIIGDDLKLGTVNFSGSLIGFVNDFVAKGNFTTRAGKVYSDLNLKMGRNLTRSSYNGNLVLSNFDLGKMPLGKNVGGIVNFNGHIDGTGLTRQSAGFRLNADVENLELNGHEVDYISTNGDFAANFFSGNVVVFDPFINVNGNAKIDFNSSVEEIELDLRVDSVDLYSLGLARKPLKMSFDLFAGLNELNINETNGVVVLKDIKAYTEDTIREFGSFRLTANSSETKDYRLETPELTMSLHGQFLLTDVVRELPRSLNEFGELLTRDNKEVVVEYLPQEERREIDANFHLEAGNIDLYLDALGLPPRFSPGLVIDVSFVQKNDAYLSCYAEVDTLKIGNRSFYHNVVEFDASKDLDSLGVLALLLVSSDEQDWDVVANTSEFVLESVWNNNRLNANFTLNQPENQSEARVKADVRLVADTIEVKLISTILKAFEQSWKISQGNTITFVKDQVLIDDLKLSNQQQSIAIQGEVGDSLPTDISVDFESFEMRNLSAVLPKRFDGILTGNASFTRSSARDPWRFESDAKIGQLSFEDILVGNLSGRSVWDRNLGGVNIDYEIERENIKTIRLQGLIQPTRDNRLDLTATFDRANFNVIEPFFSNLISDVSGYANGRVKITGSIKAPVLDGQANLRDGQVTIDYLNTHYEFSGSTRFSDSHLSLDNIQVRDRFGNNATVTGGLSHNNFRNFESSVSVDHQNFELLNTSRNQNKIYYGNAFSTGRLELIGPINNILIRANVTTAPNTRIYIPLVKDSDITTQSYITFFNADSLASDEIDEEVELKGITLDFNVNVTEDAYAELIFDPRTGDIIRGRTAGNLQMVIDSEGQFELFGSLQVVEGAYNFTTSLINKEFEIEPGGSIRWYGDPYQGQLDLEATYRQIADPSDWRGKDRLSDLVNRDNGSNNSEQNSSSLDTDGLSGSNLRAPVLVILELTGPMMNPNFDFRLELDPQAGPQIANETVWRDLLTNLNNNETELRRQVFSLLILRQFTPENSFLTGNNNVLSGSVSEFVSNQLSYWLNQVDENLEISIDLGTLDQDALNTFQLRLAYTFLDGRLRVTRDGAMTFVVDETNNNVANNIIGDWSVEYLLTEDGKLRIRLFTRTDQTLTTQNDFNPQPGISFQYVQSFDELKEFFGFSKNENEDNPPTSQTSTTPDASNFQRP